MKKTMLMMAMAVASLTVYAQKENSSDTLRVTTNPQMHCENCESKIKKNIRFVKGVKNIETSIPEQKVTIIYDSKKSDYKTIEAAFKEIGYEIKKAEEKKTK